MRIIEKIKILYRQNEFAYYMFYPLRITYNIFFFYLIPDRLAIERKFHTYMGYKLDWNSLKTFSEKLQWLKLYDRKGWYTDCADKFNVREYVTKKLGTDKYLIPIYFETTDWRNIRSEVMPDVPFVIKCNHDNSSYTIVYNKAEVDWKNMRLYYRRRLNGRSFFWANREWPYKNIKPRIMVEKLLFPRNKEEGLLEYKFYCFSGKIKIIQLSILKQGKKSFMYLDENYIPFGANYHIGEMEMIRKMPEIYCQVEMQNIAQTLAKDFEYHIRVDIYQVDKSLYIGELTFFDGAGFDIIYPQEWNVELGSYLHLPIDKK